jgi:hypothetical protein
MLQITGSLSRELSVQPGTKALITERVRGEFREMPGLTLTLAQAGRLWSLDHVTCNEVLGRLVEAGFLCKRPDGSFCRATDLAARPLRMAKASIEFIDIEQPTRTAAEG